MTRKFETPNFERALDQAKRMVVELPKILGAEAEGFFKGSFENQGFTDKMLMPWRRTTTGKSSLFGKKSQGILIGTGTLKRAIRYASSAGYVEIRIDDNIVPYAEIHNTGGKIDIPLSKKSRKFFWYMFFSTGDMMWKYMAITKKKKITVTIPKRQFIGESQALNASLEKLILNEVETIENTL